MNLVTCSQELLESKGRSFLSLKVNEGEEHHRGIVPGDSWLVANSSCKKDPGACGAKMKQYPLELTKLILTSSHFATMKVFIVAHKKVKTPSPLGGDRRAGRRKNSAHTSSKLIIVKSKVLSAAKLNVTKNTHGEGPLKGSPQKLLILS